jgi:excisionase family DNA binding protein
MSSESRRRLLTVIEARKRLAIGNVTLYKLINSGDLRSVKIGARRLVPEDAIDEYIGRLELAASAGGDAA